MEDVVAEGDRATRAGTQRGGIRGTRRRLTDDNEQDIEPRTVIEVREDHLGGVNGFYGFHGTGRPRIWAERAYPNNLIYYNKLDRGGHFAAWEQPELFASEMRAAFRSLR